ncbi:sensor histidine kinase [Micromonospora rifamycinica]|uniref:histidine kinase n=1 Tax=Micromonospora rifamycinica TaxID=291594 RepID=A0A109IF71_9ACTN|nr:histidine kinase [Micromonospora rifamycinica]KWV29440.1 histidine kinase [Micromonospora rifamycinica]SCG37847.1 Signal transduction histidine kinase [Micromonospora rifamycinica]
MTVSPRRGTSPATTVAAHAVLAVLTVLALVGNRYYGAHPGQILAAAGAAVLLHRAAVVSRRRPWVGYATGALGMLVLATISFPGWSAILLPSALCFPFTLWRLTGLVPVRSSVVALAVAVLGIVVTEAVAWSRLPPGIPGWTLLVEGGLLVAVVGGVWGAAVLVRRRHEAGRRAESERLAVAVADERASIRRDLHDVIAHTVTVMVARIEAAAVTTADPATRRELGDIAETGRDAHQGLRAMLATLGPATAPDAGARRGQVPISLDAIADLVAAAASPLHAVTFTQVGRRRPLSLSAEVAAVRTVQEGVTNALRHLEPPVAVTVRLRWTPAELEVEVRDDGGTVRRGTGSRGTGLLGVGERVRTAGGSLSITQGDDGWVLRARLPTKEGA